MKISLPDEQKEYLKHLGIAIEDMRWVIERIAINFFVSLDGYKTWYGIEDTKNIVGAPTHMTQRSIIEKACSKFGAIKINDRQTSNFEAVSGFHPSAMWYDITIIMEKFDELCKILGIET